MQVGEVTTFPFFQLVQYHFSFLPVEILHSHQVLLFKLSEVPCDLLQLVQVGLLDVSLDLNVRILVFTALHHGPQLLLRLFNHLFKRGLVSVFMSLPESSL